ncbi:MAG: ATP-binding protein [Clostridiaceae bacterium]|nr:ATP-binding protein [Clostridiaceae bacterium]
MKVTKVCKGYIFDDVNNICTTVKEIISTLENTIGINSDDAFDTKIILHELLRNATAHGNCYNCNKKVYVDVCVKEGNLLVITIKDQGQGFDPYKVIEKEHDECHALTLSERGRGLLIVKNLCDDISFNKKGNCITVKKKLAL